MKSSLLFIFIFIFIFIISCNPETKPKNINFNLNIENNKLNNNPKKLKVQHKDFVKLNITTDQNTKIHIHGYDIEKELQRGSFELIEFEATATGRFSITIHSVKNNHTSHTDSKSPSHDEDDNEEKQLVVLEVIPK